MSILGWFISLIIGAIIVYILIQIGIMDKMCDKFDKIIEKEYADPSDYNNNNNCKNYKYSLIKHINNIILESV